MDPSNCFLEVFNILTLLVMKRVEGIRKKKR